VAEYEMNYVLVPDNQPRQSIYFFNYPDESDLDGGVSPYGLYPIPTNQPIETWPVGTSDTLLQWQIATDDGDRHAIMVAPGAGFFWETWLTQLTNSGWQASNGAKFNLNTNGLRPNGWTSGDAAGFPMFQALVRYDEAERGMVEHACRIVVAQSRKPAIYPATHSATSITGTNYPAMGQRIRLKAAFVVPATWTKEEKAVLGGMKKYGAMVADNGNFFSISVTPDDRWPANCFSHFTSISITNFEVVVSTGATEGPRSPGAPSANAGPNQTVLLGQTAQLNGQVVCTSSVPTIQWLPYSGPGTVTFGTPTTTNTTASFSAPGVYTLELSAADGIHAVAYSAVTITVTNFIKVSIGMTGTNLNLSWAGGNPPFVVERTGSLVSPVWNGIFNTSAQQGTIPATNGPAFFRVRGN